MAPNSLDTRQPLFVLLLILYRRELVIETMAPPSIVKHLYVIEYITACSFARCVDMMSNALALK